MIKRIRLGDVFVGFDDAEVIELEEKEETKLPEQSERGKGNDYKQNQI